MKTREDVCLEDGIGQPCRFWELITPLYKVGDKAAFLPVELRRCMLCGREENWGAVQAAATAAHPYLTGEKSMIAGTEKKLIVNG